MYKNLYSLVLLLAFVAIGCAEPDNSEISKKAERYIVVLKNSQVENSVQAVGATSVDGRKGVIRTMMMRIAAKHALPEPDHVYSVVLQGGAYKMGDEEAARLLDDPDVEYIEKDQIITLNAVQSSPAWGLDRIDQQSLPLNHSYSYDSSGSTVNAYVIDTGIRKSHSDFGGRVVGGYDFVDNDSNYDDCNGHGTHVAGTIGGSTYGVAKNTRLYGIRVLNCSGSGAYSDVIAGIEWVTKNHVKPAVANMSLGGSPSTAVDEALASSVAAGVTYVVAAGNSATDACKSSPAREPSAITVGSTTKTDARSSFSNYGNCVNVFAPGSEILSAWYTSNTATKTISGTSMASPHTAGVVALYLAKHPSASPAAVRSALLSGAVSGKISNAGTGSPNKLVNTGFVGGGGGVSPDPGPQPEPEPEPSNGALKNGVAVSGLSGARLSEKYYTISVPSGSSSLVVSLSGGSGDADIYVRYGSKPTISTYQCRPYKAGNAESCSFSNPSSGTWHIMVRGYAAYSGASLKATYSGSNTGSGGTTTKTYIGKLSSTGSFSYNPSIYSSASGFHELKLSGPAGTNFDLVLFKKSGTSTWTQVAKSASSGSSEEIKYQGSAGDYRVQIVSASGSGQYSLWAKVP